jgi:PKD repeat protein
VLISRKSTVVAALFLSLTVACQHKGDTPLCGKVLSLSGTAHDITAGEQHKERPLVPGAPVHTGRVVSVSQASWLVIDIGNGRTISSAGPAQFVIDSLEGRPPLEYPIMRLQSGELFLRTLAQVELAFPPGQPVRITPSVEGTQFSLLFLPASSAAIITVVSGIVGVKMPDAKEIDVPSCFKLLVKSDGTASRIVQAASQDFQKISTCAGASADSLERLTFCKQVEPEPFADEPPEWLRAPKGSCVAGTLFLDTLAAKAHNGAPTYKLVNGPRGMTVDSRTGIMRFAAKTTGAFDVQVSAENSSGAAASTSYKLTVLKKQAAVAVVKQPETISAPVNQESKGKKKPVPGVRKQEAVPSQAQSQSQEAPAVNVMLDLPSMAEPGDTVRLDATRSKDLLDTAASLSFRFDANGDGVWDVPASGFSNARTANHVYAKEGVFKVVVEAQAKSGRTAQAEGRLMVRVPPTATIEIRPPLPVAGSACTLDAKKSTVSSLGKQSFVVRWDLDNNGTWDVPANGGFSTAITAVKTLDGPGPFRVVLQVKDEAGLTSKAIAEIPLTPVFKVILLSMPDTALTDIQFSAACQTSYPPSEIAEYDWDFNGDGIFEVKQEKHQQPHEYKKTGTYKVSCRAVARNGNQSTGTRAVVVVSRGVTVKAHVPQQAQALVPAEFDGEISARHTKVEQVGWDFEGDGTFDWTSPSSAKAKYAFAKTGTYHPVLRAISADKHEWRDTTTILVTASVPPRAVAGKNILAKKGDNVGLEGTGVVTSGKIILYEWDFDNDGVYDWKSEKTGSVSHKYLVFSRAVLRVTAQSGATAADTLTVVICPEGMIGVRQGPFCIDRYEYPGAKGQVPAANVTYADAEQQCKKENKRLCTSDEWERACSGPGRQRYPQPSTQYSGEPCNVLTRNSPGHIVQSGSFDDCRTPYGVNDMNGNVAEWTAPVKNGSAFAYGGTWLFPAEKATCSSRVELKASSAYPYVGFRCCK